MCDLLTTVFLGQTWKKRKHVTLSQQKRGVLKDKIGPIH